MEKITGYSNPKEKISIKDYTENYEIVGHFRNFNHDVSITVHDVKEYVPKSEWGITMASVVEQIKELNSN